MPENSIWDLIRGFKGLKTASVKTLKAIQTAENKIKKFTASILH